ncbi:hypothetical protein ACLB2K_049296 [Fragaria x ananassa]
MNLIVHNILGKILEVYIDDVVVKSKVKHDHITDLRKMFERMRAHGLRMNPAKCVSWVQAEDFLGCVVHQRGIEVPGDKAKAVINAPAPKTKKELQQLFVKINFLRRFISNSVGKVKLFSSLLKLQGAKEFVWETCHQEAFDRIKEYLANPPVLVPPKPGIPLKLYISASESSIIGLLAQDDNNQEGRTVERTIYYLSRTLLDAETKYSPIERLCLAFYFAGCKLRHYMLSFTTVTGQAVSDFLLHHPIAEDHYLQDLEIGVVYLQPWTLYFDGSSTDKLSGLAQIATGVSLADGIRECILEVEKRTLPLFMAKKENNDEWLVAMIDALDVDWRQPIMDYLSNLSTVTISRFVSLLSIMCRRAGATFMADETQEFLSDYWIKFLHSTPYYAQSNGQAEASNKIILSILKRMLADNPHDWQNELDNTPWAYRTSKRTPTVTTPYALMFGHDVVLPLEINVQSLHKVVLPLTEKLHGRGKWSPKWEGLFVIDQIYGKGAYRLRDIDGDIHRNSINGRCLKKYFPSVWEFNDPPPANTTGGQDSTI